MQISHLSIHAPFCSNSYATKCILYYLYPNVKQNKKNLFMIQIVANSIKIVYISSVMASKQLFDDKYIPAQLKKLREHYNYTQAEIADILKRKDHQNSFSRQLWSHWEQKKRNPDPAQLALIASVFEVDINYFFTENAPDPGNGNGYCTINIPDTNRLVPLDAHFIKTTVAEDLFNRFNECMLCVTTAVIEVFPGSGVTTIIHKYAAIYKENTLAADAKTSQDIILDLMKLTKDKADNNMLILVDNADLLENNHIKKIITTYRNNFSLCFICTDNKFEDMVDDYFIVMDTDDHDFNAIAQVKLPNSESNVINLLRHYTHMDLKKLDLAVKKIQQQKIDLNSKITKEFLLNIL